MNIARTICAIRNQSLCRNLLRNFRTSAANKESSQATKPQVQEEKFDFEDLKVLERTERRKAKIQPFMKNIFVSIFDRDLLAYPEILNKDESEELEHRLSNLEKVFGDPEQTQEQKKEALKRTKMYAAPVSLTNGGLAMNVTESLRYLEVISSDVQLSQQLSDHWVSLEVLKFGLDKEQYQTVIDELISGDTTITLCIKEKVAERISQPDFRTKAEMDGKGVWRITGEKLCSKTDGHYLVLSTTEAGKFKAFLVSPQAEGISHDGLYITFMKTPGVPLDLGTEQQISQALGVSRLHAATLCRGCLTRAIHSTVQYVHSRAFSGKPLSELSTIRSTFGEALLSVYASESAEYFTAGLLDGYVSPDAEMEVAMCRNFIASHTIPTLFSLLSVPALEQPEQAARLLGEARDLVLRGETLFSLNMFIALNGIHHAGRQMADEVKKIRNPLFNPTYIIRKVITNRHQERDAPKLTLHLSEHLHPSLRPPSEQLEYCVLRMKFACETLMSRHGMDIATAYTELSRLAEAATEILAMTAVLARASRSYCIGLRNAEVEMKLAACFVEKTKDKVKRLILEIDDGEFLNLDHFTVQFGKKILDSNSTIVEKPTARVFWNFIASHTIPTLFSLLSVPALEQPEQAARLLGEARDLVLRGETLFSLNMFIALNGIHHAGRQMADEVKKIRNPLFNPTYIIRKVITNRHQERDAPKLTLHLSEHLHPSLRPPSEQLEYCVLRMKFACETLMSRHGMDIATAYTELSRLAEAATEILAMTAVLARASRSYCIGLRNAEVEMKLAACFVEKTKDKVKRLILEIDDGEFLNLDHFTVQFGKKILDSNSTIVEKPTARVFW